jgi:hypothetical protein
MKTKIKLTFQRSHTLTAVKPVYRLTQIENAVTAKIGKMVEHRVGDVVDELTVQAFVVLRFDYEVKVKS